MEEKFIQRALAVVKGRRRTSLSTIDPFEVLSDRPEVDLRDLDLTPEEQEKMQERDDWFVD